MALCNAVTEALGSPVPVPGDSHTGDSGSRVAERTTVMPAFLEISEPSIGDAIDDAIAGGAKSVTVLPLFVHVGNHVERDIPDIVRRARDRHPGVPVHLRPHIGSGANFVRLVAHAVGEHRPRDPG